MEDLAAGRIQLPLNVCISIAPMLAAPLKKDFTSFSKENERNTRHKF